MYEYRFGGNVLSVIGPNLRATDKRALRKTIAQETGLKLCGSITVIRDNKIMVCVATDSESLARSKYNH